MTAPIIQYPKGKKYHVNEEPPGAILYFRARSGNRLVFRQSEIRDVDPTPAGAIVTTHTGCEYKVTSPKAEQIVGALAK